VLAVAGRWDGMTAHVDLDQLAGTHVCDKQQPARCIECAVIKAPRTAGQLCLADTP